jgi:DNA-directed RNA polymerase specialized sigma24 family protein
MLSPDSQESLTHSRIGGPVTSPEPWWLNNPELIAIREAALADLERRKAEVGPREPRDERDVVLDELCSGVRRRELVDARKDLARARTRYDDAVLAAREAGLSWGQIGVLLGVSRQQLHRRFRDARRRPT